MRRRRAALRLVIGAAIAAAILARQPAGPITAPPGRPHAQAGPSAVPTQVSTTSAWPSHARSSASPQHPLMGTLEGQGVRGTHSNPMERLSPPITAAPSEGPARLILRDRNVSAFFSHEGVALALVAASNPPDPVSRDRGWGLHWGVARGRPVEPRPEGPLEARVNYFVGDPARWRTDVRTYAQVRYAEVHPGVDLVIEARPHGLKYSLLASPGAEIRSVRLRYEGAQEVRILNDGAALEVVTGVGVIREEGLHCYQEGPTGRSAVAARYAAIGRQEYAIELGDFDAARPLVIDPVIGWSSFLGGTTNPSANSNDSAFGIAVDGSGNVYVTGETYSADFPQIGAFDAALSGSTDAFVTKVTAAGSTLAWSSYLGGAGDDYGAALALDTAGNVFVTGSTTSSDFPASGGFDTSLGGTRDAFVTKIDSTGSTLAWSSYLGGTGDDYSYDVVLDSGGNA